MVRARIWRLALPAASLVGAGAQELSAQAGTQRPLILAKEGYFFAGGEYFTTESGQQLMADQMYVRYWIPQNVKHRYPIIFIHGGGLTGTYFEGTPDGREGWTTFFARQGYVVYNVDQPARGRSAYHPAVHGPQTPTPVSAIEQSFTATAEFNGWPQAHLHTQWPGSGRAGDPIFDQFFASEVPATTDSITALAIRTAMSELLDSIGPAIIVTHSQSGMYGWPIADRRPNKVAALVTVEGGQMYHTVPRVGPPDWWDYDAAVVKSVWGITNIRITYEPDVQDPSELTFVREPVADRPDVVRCELQAEPARQLPRLQGIPMLILVGEASFIAPREHCPSKYLKQAGVDNTFVRLEDVGIHGNGHMMMIEKNNLEIAAFIQGWLEKNVRGETRPRK
jgi:pimeloyl-ACP methyl ester carboxylesterase